MPVPVTPQKKAEYSPQASTQDLPVGLDLSLNSCADPCVLAGYEDCLRETIRFLVQEEQLPAEHPLVAGLNFHLTSGTAHQELLRISEHLAERLNEDLRSRATPESDIDSGVETALSDEEVIPCAQAYQITLEEEDDSDLDGMEADQEDESDREETSLKDLITVKDILSDPYLSSTLIRFVFQGCDLVLSPLPSA